MSATPLISYDTRIRRNRMSWSTQSNAAERSNSVSATRSLLSSADRMSDVTSSTPIQLNELLDTLIAAAAADHAISDMQAAAWQRVVRAVSPKQVSSISVDSFEFLCHQDLVS